MNKNIHPIVKILNSLNMTYRELAEHIGICYETLSRYANNKCMPRPKNCYKIIDFAKKHNIEIKLEELLHR